MPANFIITNQIDKFQDYTVIPLESEKIQTLRGFYEEIADALEFPDSFGFNLDSLEEMLNDLSWLEDERIAIYIEDSEQFILKERNPSKLATLLDSLDATCEDWRWADEDGEIPKKELIFVFNYSGRIQNIFEAYELNYEER